MNQDEQNLHEPIAHYPDNALESKRILGIKMRNLIEAGVMTVIAGFIITQIPFVTRVKIIFLIIICLSVAFVNFIGIKNQSLTEALINWIMYRKNKTIYHYKDLTIERQEKKVAKHTSALNESMLEKGIRIAKERYREYKHNEQFR